MPLAAVIGAGPSGFYATEQLLQAGFEVDVYDALPTPYGLVRAGVAPDHPKIKSVTRMYDRTASCPRFRFFGGVEVGAAVTRADLLERYHAVVYAIGTATDNALGIPGERRTGSIAAGEFVAWYNGHPGFAERRFDLSCARAVVIGNGNVAIDVARMLVLEPGELRVTDCADHAIHAFGRAAIREVVIVGRRGPGEAAFTNPELRELGQLAHTDVVVDPAQLEGVAEPDDTTARRNLEILRGYASRAPEGRSHRIVLRFLRSPVEILGPGGDGPVNGVRLVCNRLEPDGAGGTRAVATAEEEVIECGLVVRSIGYRGRPLPGVPFDERRGLIPNAAGRVLGPGGEALPGEYAVGWIKRGPSGVIGTNKKDAAETTAQIIADAQGDRLGAPAAPDRAAILAWLRERVPGFVTWDGWQAIDEQEVGAGVPQGRPRVKLVRVGEMVDVARGQSAATGDTRFASRSGSVKPAAARAATPAVTNAARGSAS